MKSQRLISKIWLGAVLTLLLPAMAHAADITGVPKIRDGDQIQIGGTRIRLGIRSRVRRGIRRHGR